METTNIERNSTPLIGDVFPEMIVQTTHGVIKLPHHFEGKWFVLFSHPADFTPVCTTEFVAFQKNYDKFRSLNCELIGLSIDQVYTHIKWLEWIKDNLHTEIQFPVIADSGGIANTLGLIHPGKGSTTVRLGVIHPGAGTNTVRAVFIVDNVGIVRFISYYPNELGRNIDEILRCIEGIQLADKNSVSIPADWPHNELFGDHVIVPAAKTVDEAQDRLSKAKTGEYEYVDWWLCHKKIEKP